MQNLEAPNYSRPAEVYGMEVPVVLLSGDDEAINAWKKTAEKQLNNSKL